MIAAAGPEGSGQGDEPGTSLSISEEAEEAGGGGGAAKKAAADLAHAVLMALATESRFGICSSPLLRQIKESRSSGSGTTTTTTTHGNRAHHHELVNASMPLGYGQKRLLRLRARMDSTFHTNLQVLLLVGVYLVGHCFQRHVSRQLLPGVQY